MTRNLPIIGIVLLPLLATQCHKSSTSSQSDLKTLDNVARNDNQALTVNECGIDYKMSDRMPDKLLPYASKIKAKDSEIASKEAAIGALAHVPVNLLKLFFDVAGGQIEIGSTDACKNTPFSAEEKEVLGKLDSVPSCWVAPKNQEPLKIILAPEPKLIRYALIRLFTFVQTEYFLERVKGPDVPAPFNQPELQTYVSEFTLIRDLLTEAFIDDVKSQRKADIAAKLAEQYKQDPVGFGNIIYANAVDSYYCSASSRDVFERDFQKTWKVYTDRTVVYSPINQFDPM